MEISWSARGITSTRKALIIILLAIAASALIMESGVYSSSSCGSGGSGLTVGYKDIDVESLEGCSFAETKSGYTLYMAQGNGDVLTVDIKLDVESMSIEGSYWMPFFKRLKCHYSGTGVTTDNLMDISFNGHIDDLSIVGFCSPFAARRIARQKAMDEIERMMEDHFDTVAQHVQGESSTGWTVTSS